MEKNNISFQSLLELSFKYQQKDINNININNNIKYKTYKLLLTGLNDAVNAIISLFFAPAINGACSLRILSKVYRLDVRMIMRNKILLVFRFHRKPLSDKQLISDVQSDVFNIL